MHSFVNVYFLFLFLPTIWEIRGFVSEKAILMIFSQGRLFRSVLTSTSIEKSMLA